MKLDIRVVSQETIKPSSPTPNNLFNYNLSFLDQISPPVYNPLILFYPKQINHDSKYDDNPSTISNLLKQSLSKLLSHYYPLAGRIRDSLVAHCNDEGIPYLEAQVSCKISDVLHENSSSQPNELLGLVPFQLHGGPHDLPLGVQFNVFQCGGIALGLCMSHKLADASSTISFVKAWAAMAKGQVDVQAPEFVSSKLFPPRDMSGFDPKTGIMTTSTEVKRFVFRGASIEALRAKYGKSRSLEHKKPPSRIETLSAFIWRRVMTATSNRGRLLLLLHAVNLRTRMDPALAEHSFGNYYRVAITVPNVGEEEEEEEEEEGGCLIAEIRDAISGIDKGFVKSLQGQGGDEHLDYLKQQSEGFVGGEVGFLSFTSLCWFDRYEADFGWGKPLWVGTPSLSFKNLVVFMDSAHGDGIEALVHLEEGDMGKLQCDEVLLQYANVIPSSSSS
ncbi:unnamed protein product [Linum tenue]|uniref:Uncharacterized protein n=1 Tax=Linum tenue TaxID=586396 RepID=A0AAV0S657_9ROSI|nr:unnamed protein product [Linum tenue]